MIGLLLSTAVWMVQPEPTPHITLLGSRSIDCGANLADAQESTTLGCHTISAGMPLRIKIDTPDSENPIVSWRYEMHRAADLVAIRSGQFIDSAGKSDWQTDFKMPREAPGSSSQYVLQIEIERRGKLAERWVARIKAFAPRGSSGNWRVSGSAIRLSPHGCWKQVPEPSMTLSLRLCENDRSAIKAVVVRPNRGISLSQYVTNSIELYARMHTWKVDRRVSVPPDLGRGEMLTLEQTIGTSTQHIVKYFIEDDDSIVIVSRYSDRPPETEPDWITRSAARD